MIEINLLPEEMRKREAVKIALPDIPIKKTLLVSGAVLLSLQLLLMIGALYVRVDLSSLSRNVSALREQNREVLRQKADIQGMQMRMKEVHALATRRFAWASLLNAVSQSMTKGVWLTDVRIVDEEVRPTVAPPKAAAKGSKSQPAKGAENKENKEKDKKEKDKEKEKPAPVVHEKVLILEGSAIGAGQETAYIGKFLKEIKSNAVFADLFSDIQASNINQKRFGEYEVYGFTVSCRFKKDKAP